MLLAYSKITLYAALLDSDLPEDPALTAELAGYFPAPLPERFGDRLPQSLTQSLDALSHQLTTTAV